VEYDFSLIDFICLADIPLSEMQPPYLIENNMKLAVFVAP